MANICVLFKIFLYSQIRFEVIFIRAWMRLLVSAQKIHHEIIINGYICMTCKPKISHLFSCGCVASKCYNPTEVAAQMEHLSLHAMMIR
jgi:hypothetical protein